jgi:hypothetical protein
VAVFSSSKLNHIFCNSPFLRTLPDLVRQKLELNLNSKDLLESLVKKHPKGIFPLAFLDILKVFSRTRGSMISDDSLQSSWEEIIQEAQVRTQFLILQIIIMVGCSAYNCCYLC